MEKKRPEALPCVCAIFEKWTPHVFLLKWGIVSKYDEKEARNRFSTGNAKKHPDCTSPEILRCVALKAIHYANQKKHKKRRPASDRFMVYIWRTFQFQVAP